MSGMAPLEATRSRPFEGGPSFSRRNRITRLAFGIAWALLARWTPAYGFHGWRVALLRAFGARIGRGVKIYPDVRIWLPSNLTIGNQTALAQGVDCYTMAPITIGNRVVVSQRAYLCAGTHDLYDREFQLVTRPISIGDHAWLAAESFVGPGVEVGEGAVLGARGCATRHLAPWSVYAGNPATRIRARQWRA